MKQFEITITDEFAGVKPKNYLKKVLDVNYNQLIKAIKNKRISINGKKIKEEYILQVGDVIAVWDSEIKLRDGASHAQIDNSQIEVKNLHIKTIYEHKDFLILNKLPGIVVQGAYDNSQSLSKHLRYLESKYSKLEKLHHVHRLDKDTSGCLLIGNGTTNIRELNSLFQKGNISKTYLAICTGNFGKKEGNVELYLTRNEEGKLPKVIVGNEKNGKKTLLKYKVIKEFEFEEEDLSLVEVELITGFMHQIRVTLHHLGHPIVGDSMYSNERVNEKFSSLISRQLLHSSKIAFEWRGENIEVEAELGEDFKELLE
ncbi:MAG: RluA family pseudouridine synthase [Nanoarchaeota archaeon]|nr:RluA family pseudouridine synthase [Nanoarchaeota archaeon]